LAGMTFGAVIVRWSPESRDVRGVDAVSGRPYAASDPALLLWVHAAGLARGRTLTSYHTLRDDLRNAGATWANREVVRGNPVTGRQRSDIPAVTREMLNLFAAARGA